MRAQKRPVSGTTTAVALVSCALALSLARTILGLSLPLAIVAASAALAAVLSVTAAATRRIMLAVIALMLLCSAGAAWRARPTLENEDQEWYARKARSVDSALVAAGERIHKLELLSTGLGERVQEFMAADERSGTSDSLAFRISAFNFLERLANEVKDHRALPRGMEIGIQLFNRRGERIAWAGWPQAMKQVDERLLTSGSEIIYTRQVSLYRVLTHMMPVLRDDWQRIGTAVVEIPIEANYKVNNKFITGASLADEIEAGMAGAIGFEYYSAAESTPARKRGDAAAKPQAPAEGEGFPSYLQPLSDIRGDLAGGLSRSALVKNSLGAPLLNISVRGYPLRHDLERYRAPFLIAARILVLAAFLLFFVMVFAMLPRSSGQRITALKALLLLAFIVAFRYALLSFQTATPAGGWKVFDPVIFATPALWGLLRSAGDLLITAFAFAILLYGVMKIVRSGERGARAGGPQGPSWFFAVKAILSSLLLLACFELSKRFIHTVVVNANPRLIGQAVDFFESQVIVLHLGVFMMLVGIMLSAILGIWGIFRLRGARDARNASLLTASAAAVVSAVLWGWVFGVISLLLMLFVFFAPRFIHREDLVSIVIAAFYLVVIVSGIAYSSFTREYQDLRKIFVQEKAAEIANPSDNYKAFILEDILDGIAKDPVLLRALRRGGTEEIKNLGFDFWAESPLSLLGYSSAIYIFDRGDSVVSRFAVDMPFRADFSSGRERIDTPSNQTKAVLNLTKSTARGKVLFYRGIVSIEEFIQEPGANVEKYVLGKVIIDVPYFFENLSWAALTGPRTPEILRNVQEGGIEPRLEEPDALLLARLRGTLVLESSSDDLPAGVTLPADKIQRAGDLRWPLLALPGGACRFMVDETDQPGITLLAGFKTPSLIWHGLRWSTLLSLYMLFSFAIILFIVMLKQIPFLNVLLPTLTPVRRLEFQQKLVASFLVTALVPAIILGLFSVQMIKNRFIEENKEEAFSKALNARKTLGTMLREEFKIVSNSVALDSLSLAPDRFDEMFGGLDGRMVVLYAGQNDKASYTEEDIFIMRDGSDSYIGVFSLPFTLFEDGYPSDYYFYYGRKLDTDLLGEVADQVGADVNVYYQGELLASSREGLLASGLINAVMNTEAFKKVSLLGVDHALTTEHAGGYRYQVAYLPLDITATPERAALSLPLLFQAASYTFEVQKATAVVFGIFALLFAATIALGLVLARGIFEPLKFLLEGTRRIARGELTYKLPLRRQDEIGTVIEAFNDMTDKLAGSQTALEERKRYLEAILANIGTGVISTDAENRIQTLNNAAEKILGIDAETALGTTARALVDAAIVPEFFAVLDTSSRSPEPFLSSELTVAKNNRRNTIKWMHTKLTYGERFLGTVFVFEDLTELITSKKLSAWVEMSRQIAHEIKNPLTPIKLSTQFMQKAFDQKSPEFDKIFRESSDTIIHQVDVLKRIAGEFSSFGKMQQLAIEQHRLAPLIESIVAPYTHNTSGVAISLILPDPGLTVLMDQEAFRKICSNLIENALEAMPGGGSLAIEAGEVDRDGTACLRLVFRDSGQGLSDTAVEKLFEPYFSTKTTGTGLGLAICRSLSREMDGDVTIENKADGSGAVATLILPLA